MNEKGVWRTIRGRRVFIREGEDLESAMKRSGKFDNLKRRNVQMEQAQKKIDKLGKKNTELYKKNGGFADTGDKEKNKQVDKAHKQWLKNAKEANELKDMYSDYSPLGWEKDTYNNPKEYTGDTSDLEGKHIAGREKEYQLYKKMRLQDPSTYTDSDFEKMNELDKKYLDKFTSEPTRITRYEDQYAVIQNGGVQGTFDTVEEAKKFESSLPKSRETRAREIDKINQEIKENKTIKELNDEMLGGKYKGKGQTPNLIYSNNRRIDIDNQGHATIWKDGKIERKTNLPENVKGDKTKDYFDKYLSEYDKQNASLSEMQDSSPMSEWSDTTGSGYSDAQMKSYKSYLKSAYGTDDESIINAGREFENRVSIEKFAKEQEKFGVEAQVERFKERKGTKQEISAREIPESVVKRLNQKGLKEMADNGATDITRYSESDLKKLEKKHGRLEVVKRTMGTYGMNGGLFRSNKTGEYFVVTSRNGNLFYLA